MKRIYISTTNRLSKEEDSSLDRGEIYCVDWDDKKVLATLEAEGPDPVMVGRSRGCSGLAWFNGQIYAACRSGVSVLNPDSYTLLRRITIAGPVGGYYLSGAHQLGVHKDHMYVTSTGNSEIFVLDTSERVIDHIVVKESDLDALALGSIYKERGGQPLSSGAAHLNSLCWNDEGDLILLFMSGGVVFNWTRRETIGILGPGHAHDLLYLGGSQFMVNHSGEGKTYIVEPDLKTPRLVRESPTQGVPGAPTRQGFLRGSAWPRNRNTLFLTSAPGKITEVDIHTWQDVDSLEFSTTPNEAPYDILLDPRDW